MSTQQSSQGHSRLSIEANQQRLPQQGAQWRDIGISAVAAAASQTSDKRAHEAKPAQAAGEPKAVVTIRDIEHLAA